MKTVTRGVLFCALALATAAVYGGQEDPGVIGINVVVKQMPNRRDVTNAWGIFAFDPLPAGSYTLSFKARPAKDSRSSTRDKVVVAKTYSIKIEGAQRPVSQSGLTSDQLLAGGYVPQPDGCIVAGRRQSQAVVRKGDALDLVGVTFERPDLAACRHLP